MSGTVLGKSCLVLGVEFGMWNAKAAPGAVPWGRDGAWNGHSENSAPRWNKSRGGRAPQQPSPKTAQLQNSSAPQQHSPTTAQLPGDGTAPQEPPAAGIAARAQPGLSLAREQRCPSLPWATPGTLGALGSPPGTLSISGGWQQGWGSSLSLGMPSTDLIAHWNRGFPEH